MHISGIQNNLLLNSIITVIEIIQLNEQAFYVHFDFDMIHKQ